jgi:hypothetical protein
VIEGDGRRGEGPENVDDDGRALGFFGVSDLAT